MYNVLRDRAGPQLDDAVELMQWLQERSRPSGGGYYFSHTLDVANCLENVYSELEEAVAWRGSGFDLVLYDTTHGSNGYNMKLGCFTSSNGEGRTVVLATSLLKYEDSGSFTWAFQEFAASL